MNRFQIRIMRAVVALEAKGADTDQRSITDWINNDDPHVNCSTQAIWRHIPELCKSGCLVEFENSDVRKVYWHSTELGRGVFDPPG